MATDAASLARAERALLELADFVYAHTALKPMSKALFLLSRVLVTAALEPDVLQGADLASSYRRARRRLGGAAPVDDFDLGAVAADCGAHLARVLETVARVLQLAGSADTLGLAFDTLLRGKWESGEGLGTYLTPEEVAGPMVRMLLDAVEPDDLARIGAGGALYGDICGGSGRFVWALAQQLAERGAGRADLERGARLFDQSSLAVGFASVNFALGGLRPSFARVGDSLLAPEVSALAGRCLLLATNPPFGTGKYAWQPALRRALPVALLERLGLRGAGDTADPAELFLFRNLALLAPGGGLAIVLPDGVMQAPRLLRALEHFETLADLPLSIEAAVSLPGATFALGGTVAKTSFLIVRRLRARAARPLYVALAEHVGFQKRGNRRAPDPAGNDLPAIAADWRRAEPQRGARVACWREHERLVAAELALASAGPCAAGRPLRALADAVRAFGSRPPGPEALRAHISVLDIDPTGLLDVAAALAHEPVSPPLLCEPGDVLVSCINPRIWRVAVVPRLEGIAWSCSSELLVLRPKPGRDAWAIALALHHGPVIAAVRALAGGTSSSRQRVARERVLDIELPLDLEGSPAVARHASAREAWYRERIREASAYQRLHDGADAFAL